jgi:hypothetical protein
MWRNCKLILIIALYFLSFPAAAQKYNGNSLYSKPGLGEYLPFGNIRNLGMGGVGLSSSHRDFTNNLNPALLNAQDSAVNKHSIFDGAMIVTLQNSRSSEASQTNFASNFSYFSYSIPVPFKSKRLNGRWTTSIGLQQFSKVNYKTTFRTAISGGAPGDSANLAYSGTGGLYQVYWGNGVDITKKLSLGIQAAYIFGNRNDESISQLIIPPSQQNQIVIAAKTNHHAIQIKPGIAYRRKVIIRKSISDSIVTRKDFDSTIWVKNKVVFGKQLLKRKYTDSTVIITRKKEINEPIYFNLGLAYDCFAAVRARQVTSFEKRDSLSRILDSSPLGTTHLDVVIPSVYRIGISLDKFSKFSIGTDFSYSPWSTYSGFDTITQFTNSFSIGLGGEWYLNSSDKKYSGDDALRKIVRTGISYSRLPFMIGGRQINDISLSLGGSFPLLRGGQKRYVGSAPPPKLNMALVAGQRGTKADGLIKELYVKFYIGIIISDYWFLKSKVD